MSTPYTYLVGWSKQNLWYYGSRFCKDCDPTDLWVKYFTSSKKVAAMREIYGEPDVISVRHRFTSRKAAIIWEMKVLRRLNVTKISKWLNQSQQNAFGVMSFIHKGGHTEETKAKMRKPRGTPSDETRNRMSEAQKKYYSTHTAHNKGIPMTEEAKLNLSDFNKGKIAWNKGIPNDAARGVPRSDEVRSKISESLKGRPSSAKQMEGTPHSDSTKDHLSQMAKNRRWYNNGTITKGFQEGANIPEGFVPGRINFNPHKNKSSTVTGPGL